jgi:gliding motility-associated lipoprotein GldB
MRIYLLLLFTMFLAFGCQNKKCEIPAEIADIKLEVKANRLEKELFACKTEAEVEAFIRKNPLFANRFLNLKRYPSEQELVNHLFQMAKEPSLQQLVKETDDRFKDMNSLEDDLAGAFKHLKHFYPAAKVPKLATFVTGMGQDLYLDDRLLVWGLDFFIGPTAKYRPQFPKYILKRYDKPYLVPTTVLLLSSQYNKTEEADNSMLSEMIANGKSLYFAQRLLPCASDSALIGYSNQEIADVYYNQQRIWAHFVEKGLLFETDQFKIKKYVGERPNVPEIGKKCPGRIGVWVGWQIVRKYMEENPEITLPQLMAETNARKILNESKYKPKKS